MKVSTQGLGLVQRLEGTVATMYRDSAGLPTIGVGHLLTKDELSSGALLIGGQRVKWADGLTEAEVALLLAQDLTWAQEAVEDLVQVPLTQHQFDALVSFVFNVGTGAFQRSTLLRQLNAGAYDSVPDQMRRWRYAGGQVDPILVKRREDEIAMWLFGLA